MKRSLQEGRAALISSFELIKTPSNRKRKQRRRSGSNKKSIDSNDYDQQQVSIRRETVYTPTVKSYHDAPSIYPTFLYHKPKCKIVSSREINPKRKEGTCRRKTTTPES